jgi:hypothetical protein
MASPEVSDEPTSSAWRVSSPGAATILADCRVLIVGGPDGLGGQLVLSALLQP